MGRVKTFDILFKDNKTVFYPGQTVSGTCVVDLKSDIRIKALRIFMRGVAKVHWTESRSTGNRLGAYTEHYNAEIEYFFKKQLLFGQESGNTEEPLTKGNHEYDFSFQLPPSSISTSFEGKYGSIRYWLKAEMEKPWSFNQKTKKAFTVISQIDINKPEYLLPVENQCEKTLCCWCCTTGPISLYARTDRKGYCPGESIAITADFDNASSRAIVPSATVYQTQTFLAAGKSRSRRTKFTTVTGVAIQPNRTANWDAQLLKIPAVTPSVLNCCLIRVDYSVRIMLQISGAYNLVVDLPVVIGTVPHRPRTAAPSYNSVITCAPISLPGMLLDHRNSLGMQAPPYRETETPPPPIDEAPPSYAECIEGSVDIGDDEDGLIGDTLYTPLYTYVHDYQYRAPPAYTEVDPARLLPD